MPEPQEPATVEVANPDYTALTSLRSAVLDAQDSLGKALDAATRQMHDGSAWTGPTAATAFAGEIAGRSGRLPGLVQQVLTAVEAEIATTPPTVTRPVNHGVRYE
ncbi:hypothetical protein ACVW00_003165 [Marmoricola sp. URHA0025 HA25]